MYQRERKGTRINSASEKMTVSVSKTPELTQRKGPKMTSRVIKRVKNDCVREKMMKMIVSEKKEPKMTLQ